MMQRVIYKFKDFLKERFPFEVRKLAIHTNLGCPHRENRTGSGGCIYCYNPGFSNLTTGLPDVPTQIHQGITKARNNGFKGKFIADFQTETNTYASIDVLEPWWREIENYPDDILSDLLSEPALIAFQKMS